MGEEVATINLCTMNKLYKEKMPWHLSFSYGKALQKTCIVTWMGKAENKEAAQKALKNHQMQTHRQLLVNMWQDPVQVLVRMATSKVLLAHTKLIKVLLTRLSEVEEVVIFF